MFISSQSVLALPEGDYVQVTLQDTGIGIDPENQAKIFDPYFSTKDEFSRKGLGLGLAVCHSIVTRHGGLITVGSDVEKGTLIVLFLPKVGDQK